MMITSPIGEEITQGTLDDRNLDAGCGTLFYSLIFLNKSSD